MGASVSVSGRGEGVGVGSGEGVGSGVGEGVGDGVGVGFFIPERACSVAETTASTVPSGDDTIGTADVGDAKDPSVSTATTDANLSG